MESDTFFTTLIGHQDLLVPRLKSPTATDEERERIAEILKDTLKTVKLVEKFQELEALNYRKRMNTLRAKILFQISYIDWRISQTIH